MVRYLPSYGVCRSSLRLPAQQREIWWESLWHDFMCLWESTVFMNVNSDALIWKILKARDWIEKSAVAGWGGRSAIWQGHLNFSRYPDNEEHRWFPNFLKEHLWRKLPSGLSVSTVLSNPSKKLWQICNCILAQSLPHSSCPGTWLVFSSWFQGFHICLLWVYPLFS